MLSAMTVTKSTLAYTDLPRLMTLMTGDEKHSASATSTLDAIWVLYDQVLNASPTRLSDPDRDRFVLSKGHGPMAYYAVLAAKGFIPVSALQTFGADGSVLGHHPDGRLIPGVEIGSGSLGHGLPIAVGMALGLRARGSRARVYCLLGDAELDEGSNWEAIQLAGRLELGALTAIVIDNRSASYGWPAGIGTRFEVEVWTADTVDGRSHAALAAAYTHATGVLPHLVVARVETT